MTSNDAPRKIGRPSKGPRVQTGLRLREDLHARATERATERGQSLNEYIEAAVARDLADADDAGANRNAA